MSDGRREPAGGAPGWDGEQLYLLICLCTLVVMVVALTEYGLGEIALIPFALGALALWMRWTSVPPFLLMVLGFLVMYHSSSADARAFRGRLVPAARTLAVRDPATAMNFILVAATVAFTIAYYRRLSILENVFPADPRKAPPTEPGGKPVPLRPARRSAALATPPELVALAVAVPAWCALGYFLWVALARTPPPPDWPANQLRGEWGLLVLCWALAVGGMAGAAFLGYLGRARATPDQSLLFLQDQLWRQTRREQSRINRWLVWARLRGQRRRERP
jgi:hypothetical protein